MRTESAADEINIAASFGDNLDSLSELEHITGNILYPELYLFTNTCFRSSFLYGSYFETFSYGFLECRFWKKTRKN